MKIKMVLVTTLLLSVFARAENSKKDFEGVALNSPVKEKYAKFKVVFDETFEPSFFNIKIFSVKVNTTGKTKKAEKVLMEKIQ